MNGMRMCIDHCLKFLVVVSLLLMLTTCGEESGSFISVYNGNDPLTATERQWLKDHPVIIVAPDPDFPPVEFFDDDGVLRGIASEYLDLIAERLGIEFEYVHLENWAEVIEEAKAKRVDILSAASPSPQRREYLLFTEPHTVIAGVIINLQGSDETLTMDDLDGLRIAVVADYIWQDNIENEYPELDLISVPDIYTGIRSVSFGEVDVFIENIATASYAIEEMAITNLQVAGETGWHTSLAFASRDDWPLLNSILDKGLELISEEERTAVFRAWVRLEYSKVFFTRSEFWKTTFIVMGSVLLILVLILLWNRSLRKEVNQRTRDLENGLADKLQLEEQLRQAQKMEAIGRLAGGIAHDFNNILQAIIGNISLIKENLSHDDLCYKRLEEILNEANRAATLIRQLLAFGRRQILQKIEIDVTSLINNLLSMVDRMIGETIEMEFLPDPDLWHILADQSQIDQVLMNLCVNARDAMPNGGVLTLKAMNVSLDESFVREHPWSMEGNFVLITVSDTGEGMDEDTISMIFDPFYTTKELGKGTGLGLATVYGIVSQHLGVIYVESTVGSGSTFSVYIPALQDRGPIKTKTSKKMVSGGSETVLLVEDDDSVRFMLLESLRNAGYRVLAASNGNEVLKLLSANDGNMGIAVLDVIMPGMTGFQINDIILKRYPDIQTIFISGYSHDEFQRRNLREENITILQKPFHPDELLLRIREILDM
ncbi:MAG: transporter substrate-binding domain-containing protein [Candidatus Aegiribacteria sp.]|nr:transporter substrate-binding domain-containing protein [Candidatus Aegiribacteria sp.]